MIRLRYVLAGLIVLMLTAILILPSSPLPTQAQSKVDSPALAKFAAVMQYIRSQPTPSDVETAKLPALASLDTTFSNIYITGFITPYTEETLQQVQTRLQSIPQEDRFTAVMVESYRHAEDDTLLDIIHLLLPLYYVQFFTTADDLNASEEFLGRADIQSLADAFDSTDYDLPAPSATQSSGGSSPSVRSGSNVDSPALAKFAAVMQYIRSQPTPSDVETANLPALASLDTTFSNIYITGFITPYTGETLQQVQTRLQSIPQEDRFTAVMVESYRHAEDDTLLDIIHLLLPLYYVQFFTTADDLNASEEFLDRADIQSLADAFDSTDYDLPAPSATGTPMPTATATATPTPEPVDTGSPEMDRDSTRSPLQRHRRRSTGQWNDNWAHRRTPGTNGPGVNTGRRWSRHPDSDLGRITS